MIEIISGTDRPDSNSFKIANILLSEYQSLGCAASVLDLCKLDLRDVSSSGYREVQGTFKEGVDRVSRAEGLVFVVPEYNGSFPGVLKLFIDYWRYPDSFEYRPVAFVGLGGRWGGLRPVEHLQHVFGYRNAFVFPNRVFISNVHSLLKEHKILDSNINDLLKIQTREFLNFIKALQNQNLDANSRLRMKS